MRPDSDSLRRYDLAVARLVTTSLVIVGAADVMRAAGRRTFERTLSDAARANASPVSIDANSATWPELALLPGLGEQLARRVVAYREAHGEDRPAFCTPEDLDHVYGIGPGIVARVRPYLRFPRDCARRAPATVSDAETNR